MLPLLRAGVLEARTNGWSATSRPFRVGLLANALRWFLEPPYRIKSSTSADFEPAGNGVKHDVLVLWEQGHLALDRLIRDAAGLALDRPMIVSPFDSKGRVRYSVYAGVLILAAHERRHLWQVSRLAR